MNIGVPNYKRIYLDIIKRNYPHKMQDCEFFFSKEEIHSIDVIRVNTIIFGNPVTPLSTNQHHKSYDIPSILTILEFQKEKKMNNSQLSRHFKLSRNTIAKWKKLFRV